MWLDSPAHNRRKDVKALCVVLCEFLHLLKIKPKREEIYKRLFPKKIFDDQHLRHLCNYLLKATEDYLLDRASIDQQALPLLKVYRKRHLGSLFEHQYKKASKALERSSLRHPEYYWQRYLLEKERYSWDSARGRTGALNLAEQEKWLHIATLGFKLRQACLSLAHQQLSSETYEIPMLGAFIKEAKTPPYQKIPMLTVYVQILDLYKTSEVEDRFEVFNEDIGEHIDIFPQEEARDLLLLGVNFGIKGINRGYHESMKQTLALYKKGLENDLFLENGKLNAFTYNNIAGIAIRLEDLKWANQFINTFKTKLDRKYRDAVFSLNAARLAYTRQDHESALIYLQTTNDRDFIHHMSARVLQLKIYVDTEDFDQTIKHIRNTRTYLKRKNHAAYHAQNYSNILRLTEQYCKLQLFDKEVLDGWKSEVREVNPLTEREWLLGLRV